MSRGEFIEQTIEYIEGFIDSEFREIQHEHGGELIALMEPKRYVLGDDYIDLLNKLKDEDVDLHSVKIANIPEGE